jgi:uncharacterized membrane protein required for colicin V production
LQGIQPFDLVLVLGLFAMFIVGFAQGITRRLLGTAAILFALFLGAQLRTPFGGYLAQQWTNISPDYSYMIGFGAIFVATAVTLSVGIQIGYRPAPLFYRYPVLDEILGGVVGVLEGLIILMAVLIIIDPYFAGAGHTAGDVGVLGEFGPLRSLHSFIDDSVVATVMRENVIPALFSVLGGLFPEDVVKTFATVLSAAR